MWFCIPAYGHTNPTIEVVRELVQRGHEIRYYSFEDFREKIEDAGAQFVPCEEYLTELTQKQEKRIRRVSTTEMSIKAFETTALIDGRLQQDICAFRPDLIVSDSACFWGKLTAEKYHLPMVCSTTTFAFNEASSKYLKYSMSEMADMILGLPRVSRALKKLEPLGYHVKSALDIIQNRNDTDTIVYTSRYFQPCSESFDPVHYRFVGPSVKKVQPQPKDPGRPLIYISLGTVINDHPDFYRCCIEALKEEKADVLISCGKAFNTESLGILPDNITAKNYVNQMEVLSRTSLFITHCGMNSASESLYMGVPMLLFPISGEQAAVAGRTAEVHAGRILQKDEAKDAQKLRKAIREVLDDPSYQEGAEKMRQDFLACSGSSGAADFIEERAGKNR